MVYAGRYPQEVAGAVMVDVRPPAAQRAVARRPAARIVGGARCPPSDSRGADRFRGGPELNPEGLDLAASAVQAKAAPGFGDAPLVVLTAGDRAAITEGLPADLAASFDEIWMDLQTGLVGLSSSGRQEIVPDATHDMPFEQPGVIVDAIRDVLGKAAG